ncbi:hypothetical protein ACFVIM_23810 [Streptomyces sp. NPDC057638]|uniref:hypothetical protein n=1 Tax=Streptomyces sp. NPDC057638 TaxID=3346190 RepID=UPI00369111BD
MGSELRGRWLLGETACRYRADELNPEGLPMIAAEALVAGLDTPTLGELAGWPRTADPRDLRELFVQALGEARIPIPDLALARRHALRRLATRFLEGHLTPSDLARDDGETIETRTPQEHAFAALIPPCACCTAYTLGLDQQTWAAELRTAALALTASPPIGPGC